MAKKNALVKYADKSKDQPELQFVFDKLYKLLSAYEKGNYIAKGNKPGHYELYYNQEVIVSGKKFPELAFASILIQKGYVGFYFFPIYVDEKLKKDFGADLLKLLKGKTCFHIKKPDRTLLEQVKKALSLGYEMYHGRGWQATKKDV